MLSWNGRFGDTRPARPNPRNSRQKLPMQTPRARTFALLPWLALGLTLAGATAFAQTRELSSSGELLDRIAAVVNEGVVLVSELDMQTDQIIERLRQQKTELPPRNVLRRQILERLVIDRGVLDQPAGRLGRGGAVATRPLPREL